MGIVVFLCIVGLVLVIFAPNRGKTVRQQAQVIKGNKYAEPLLAEVKSKDNWKAIAFSLIAAIVVWILIPDNRMVTVTDDKGNVTRVSKDSIDSAFHKEWNSK